MELLKNCDVWLMLHLNGYHNQFLDFIMFWLSNKFIWVPFYLFMVYLIIKQYGKKSYAVIIATILLAVFTDQISNHLFKNLIQRPRPCHEPSIQAMIYTLNGYCGGKYGFVSSHASNTFGLAVFISLVLGKAIKYLTPVMFIWTISICYSRVYLGVHYPGDVICGAIFGGLSAYMFYRILALFKVQTQ